MSIESLNKIVESHQLTGDFEGQQLYDHQQWTDARLAIEDFFWQAGDMADRIDDLQEDLNRNDFAEDVPLARHAIDHHNEMRKKITKLPIEDLDMQGKKLLAKINAMAPPGGQVRNRIKDFSRKILNGNQSNRMIPRCSRLAYPS